MLTVILSSLGVCHGNVSVGAHLCNKSLLPAPMTLCKKACRSQVASELPVWRVFPTHRTITLTVLAMLGDCRPRTKQLDRSIGWLCAGKPFQTNAQGFKPGRVAKLLLLLKTAAIYLYLHDVVSARPPLQLPVQVWLGHPRFLHFNNHIYTPRQVRFNFQTFDDMISISMYVVNHIEVGGILVPILDEIYWGHSSLTWLKLHCRETRKRQTY